MLRGEAGHLTPQELHKVYLKLGVSRRSQLGRLDLQSFLGDRARPEAADYSPRSGADDRHSSQKRQRVGDRASRMTGCLPAASSPVRDGRPFGAERGVGAVARIDPRVVGEPVEELVLDVVDQALEVFLATRGCCPPRRGRGCRR